MTIWIVTTTYPYDQTDQRFEEIEVRESELSMTIENAADLSGAEASEAAAELISGEVIDLNWSDDESGREVVVREKVS